MACNKNVQELATDIAGIYQAGKLRFVAGTIRYYSATGWELIGDTEPSGHASLGVSSVSASSSAITINYDADELGGSGNYKVVSFLCGPDEDMAGEGLFVGASVGLSSATLELYKDGYSDYVRYNGSAWVTSFGRFTAAWDVDHLELERDVGGMPLVDAPPMITPRETPYHVTAGTYGTGTTPGKVTYTVWFYDASGAAVSTPDTSMKFFIYDPSKKILLDPTTDINDQFGNIWFLGVFEITP